MEMQTASGTFLQTGSLCLPDVPRPSLTYSVCTHKCMRPLPTGATALCLRICGADSPLMRLLNGEGEEGGGELGTAGESGINGRVVHRKREEATEDEQGRGKNECSLGGYLHLITVHIRNISPPHVIRSSHLCVCVPFMHVRHGTLKSLHYLCPSSLVTSSAFCCCVIEATLS